MTTNRFLMSACPLHEARYSLTSSDLSSSGTYALVSGISGRQIRLLSVVLRTSSSAEVAIVDESGNGIIGDSTFTISLDASDLPMFALTRATGIASVPSGLACMLYAASLSGTLEVLLQYTLHDDDVDVVQ